MSRTHRFEPSAMDPAEEKPETPPLARQSALDSSRWKRSGPCPGDVPVPYGQRRRVIMVSSSSNRRSQCASTGSVLLVALIDTVVSFRHMHELAFAHGRAR